MRLKLEGMDTWDKIEDDRDGMALIKPMQDITFHKDGSKQSWKQIKVSTFASNKKLL